MVEAGKRAGLDPDGGQLTGMLMLLAVTTSQSAGRLTGVSEPVKNARPL